MCTVALLSGPGLWSCRVYSTSHQTAHIVCRDWLIVVMPFFLFTAFDTKQLTLSIMTGCLYPYFEPLNSQAAVCPTSPSHSTAVHVVTQVVPACVIAYDAPAPVPCTLIMSHCMSNVCYTLGGIAAGFVTSNSKAGFQA